MLANFSLKFYFHSMKTCNCYYAIHPIARKNKPNPRPHLDKCQDRRIDARLRPFLRHSHQNDIDKYIPTLRFPGDIRRNLRLNCTTPSAILQFCFGTICDSLSTPVQGSEISQILGGVGLRAKLTTRTRRYNLVISILLMLRWLPVDKGICYTSAMALS